MPFRRSTLTPYAARPVQTTNQNSILYQRGIYPQDTFAQKKQYGLAIMVTKDDGLSGYLATVARQMTGARALCC
jgi:hypothetical protein